MNKSLLILCLVVVVSAQENGEVKSLVADSNGLSAQHETFGLQFSVPQSQDPEYLTCMTDDGKEGYCVPHYLCLPNNIIGTDGGGSINERINQCPDLDVCCKTSNVPEENETPGKPQQNRKEGCGWRNPNGVGDQTTGDTNGESKFGEFPWVVAILDPDYVGGGSLIHPAVVLTTAHKVVRDTELKVRAGEWDTQTEKEIYPYQDRDVVFKIIHKDFNRKNLFNSIALLFLSSPMDISSPNVGLACLPPPRQRAPGNTPCIACGWGKDKFERAGKYQDILKKVIVPVVERGQCQTQLRKTRLGYFFRLHSSFMCAGGESGIDTCTGDGGSPLVCPMENEQDRYVQWGMVAWGIGCGDAEKPGVYVDVSQFRDWIDEGLSRLDDLYTYRSGTF